MVGASCPFPLLSFLAEITSRTREDEGSENFSILPGHALANYFTMLPHAIFSHLYPDYLLLVSSNSAFTSLLEIARANASRIFSRPNHPYFTPRMPERRRMLLEGIRRGAHGSSPVVAPH